MAVGEVHHRIICQVVMFIVERNVLQATAPLQLCVRVCSACKPAVHAMQKMYANEGMEAVLLVNASNAFNTLSHIASRHNVQSLCPLLARVFRNTTHAVKCYTSLLPSGSPAGVRAVPSRYDSYNKASCWVFCWNHPAHTISLSLSHFNNL